MKLYLVPVVDEATRVQNQNTKQAAEAIRSARELEVIQAKGGLNSAFKSKMLLVDLYEEYRKQKLERGQSDARAWSVANSLAHLKLYAGEKVTLGKVDEEFCKGFIEYLSKAKDCKKRSKESGKEPKLLSQNTGWLYFQVFVSVLNYAVKKKLIPNNPVLHLEREDRDPIKVDRNTRTFLTIDEVKMLLATDYTCSDIRRAFLFSCFTGLRCSDVKKLTWNNIKEVGGNYFAEVVMTKTRKPLTIKLNQQALNCLPDRKKDGEVFDLPINQYSISYHLKTWATQAGIKKDVCYHMSRHTFATMELTMGGNLYVLSKLMGHQEVSTTQVYADIINKQREETIDLLDRAFK